MCRSECYSVALVSLFSWSGRPQGQAQEQWCPKRTSSNKSHASQEDERKVEKEQVANNREQLALPWKLVTVSCASSQSAAVPSCSIAGTHVRAQTESHRQG